MSEGFVYRGGALCAEEVPLEKLAETVGTPFYCYSSARLAHNCREFSGAFKNLKASVFFAIKANPNLAVIRALAAEGAGADITSRGEMERALEAGIAPQKIIYSGVGKLKDEISAALKAGIYQFNVESIPELETVNEAAAQLGKRAPIALRINPDVAAHTHRKTSTGELGTKFGIDFAQLENAMERVASLPALDFKGFQVHVGSHVYDYEPFREAYGKLAAIVGVWRAKGWNVTRLDLGGGVSIPYDGRSVAPFADYAAIVKETVGALGCELLFEPGRWLVGDAGVLVSRVTYDKHGQSKRFLILDAGMNDLVRPAMYEARHSIIPVRESAADAKLANVVGPVCETSDLFGEDYVLPGVRQGDLVAILQAGAYGASMSSNYNGRPLIPEVMVSGGQHAIVRRRITVAEQMGWEEQPPWQAAPKKQASGIKG